MRVETFSVIYLDTMYRDRTYLATLKHPPSPTGPLLLPVSSSPGLYLIDQSINELLFGCFGKGLVRASSLSLSTSWVPGIAFRW